MKATLTFSGGAGTVTGANFLLETGSAKFLIDCGTAAQENLCDSENLAPFPYDPASIDVLFVTHAHADHIGRIPKLVRDGFRGVIYSTDATKDISAVMFDDALSVMQEQAARMGCAPLYERADVDRALSLWQAHPYHEPFQVGEVTAAFLDAGHILGSSYVKLTRAGRTILFSGDIGNSPEPLLNERESPAGAHYIVMESVYGDRLHEGRALRKQHLRDAVEATRERGGVLLIPSFSIERTQILLFELNDMVEEGSMQPIPIYLDAPLATRITDLFRRYIHYLNPKARAHFEKGDDPFAFPGLTVIQNKGASQAIHREADPKVIIAGAGMSAGGRIRSHEQHYLGEKKAAVLFVGYQAPGSLGRRIKDGAEKVQIDGRYVRIHAHIDELTGYSGHADRDELLQFAEEAGDGVEKIFVTMGEPKASIFLAQRIKDFYGIETHVPEKGERVALEW